MTNQLRWGFLGTGWIANVLANDFAAIGRKVSAVGSRSLDTAKTFADAHGIESHFGSYEELCTCDEVDVVYVATPNPFHLEHAKLALANGKHVLLEKPAALNEKQVQEILDAAKTANRFLMEAMWSRFTPSQRSLKALVQAGEIGEVVHISAEYSENKLPPEAHERLWNLALGGGALLDLGIYPLAMIQNLLGNPSQIQATASLSPTGVDQLLMAQLKFDSGAMAQFSTGITGHGPGNARIVGTKAQVELDFPIYGQFEYRVLDLDRNLLNAFRPNLVASGRQFQVLAVEEAISRGNRENELMPWIDSKMLARAMDEMRLQTGVRYEVD